MSSFRKKRKYFDTNIKKVKRKKLNYRDKCDMLIKQQCKCNHCGNILRKGSIDVDHIKELADGGSNDIDNFQLLCCNCHSIKTRKRQSARAKERRINIKKKIDFIDLT